ncbi:Maf-like protein [Aquibium sp. LZ166]|uniref:7-methyl-GTP pyrophosphatase n=1 Tax=Aquibium pacificus TaxID=3153579 RepID=A0ABV3SH97_9HYPH
MRDQIILASGSPFRRKLLEDAGVTFQVVRPELDERALEAPLANSGAGPEDIAAVLAEAKAVAVSEAHPGAFVIGSDQTLSLADEVFHKPKDMEGARRHLLRLSGRTHHLNSAVVIVRNGETIWRHVAVAAMTMRDLDPGFVGRYLSAVGNDALSSVGAYQVEGRGIQLFQKIEGDYFTIVGLPLLPLLSELRSLGAIDG